MTSLEISPAIDEEAVELDAFGFVPEWLSRVQGLGGLVPCPDIGYVFHTSYSDYGEGDVLATVIFEELVATQGVLVLRVNALPHTASRAYEVMISEVPMALIKADEGKATIQFRPRPGTRYAVLGHVYDHTDAAATGARVRVEREAKHREEADRQVSSRRSAFAADVKPVAHLIARKPPILAHPVSQMCTSAQLAEPIYSEWSDRLGRSDEAEGSWPTVYTLQVLRTYGMLQSGSLGVELGRGVDALPATVAGFGCSMVVTDESATGLDSWRRPQVCSDRTFYEHVSFRPMDLARVSLDFVNFDFLSSTIGLDEIDSIYAASAFIVNTVECLKPGGVAAHIFRLERDSADASSESLSTSDIVRTFRRIDVDRLVLDLISRGHEVAQLNYLGDPCQSPAAFGLILRRGLRT